MAINSTNIGRLAGAGFTGEKLVGNLDFFTVTVLTDSAQTEWMPFASTGVVASREELVEAGELSNPTLSATNTVTIVHPVGAFGDVTRTTTEYTSNSDYDLAFAQQRNFDLLIEAVAQKAQPILMGLVEADTAATGEDIVDDGAAADGDDVARFKFAVEKTAVFEDNPNQTDPKAEFVSDLLDGVGDALRNGAVSADNPFGTNPGPADFNTYDSTTGNFAVAFSGTL